MGYDIFVSYRREGGLDFAGRLVDHLKNRGFNPFMDLEAMKSGRFDKQLYDKIDECSHFILVLSPKALNRCKNADDWVRKEVEYAIRAKKHIITIQMPGFSFPKNMPDSMEILRYFQAVLPSPDIFEHTVDRVVDYLNDQGWNASDYETAISKSGKYIQRKRAIRISAALIVCALLACAVFAFTKYNSPSNELTLDMLRSEDDDWVSAEKISANVGDEIHYRVIVGNISEKDTPVMTLELNKSLKYVSGSFVLPENATENEFPVDVELLNEGFAIKGYTDCSEIYFDFIVRVVNYDLTMTGNDLFSKIIIKNNKKSLEQYSIINVSFIDEGTKNDETITGWGDNEGGREVYTTEQVNEEYILGDRIVFNSISDWEPIGGDERNFVSCRKDTGIDAGKDNIWHNNKIYVTEEGTYLIRMYVHNNNPNGENALAKDVIAHVTMPLEAGDHLGVQCSIDSSNASPSRYWDGVDFESNKAFYLDFVEGSVLFENNGIGSNGGCRLRDDIIMHDGVKLGFESMDGIIPGGAYYDAYISFKVKVVFLDDKDYFHVDTRVHKSGESEYKEEVDVEIGDEVEYAVKYENTTNTSRENVMFRAIIPYSMEIVPESVYVINTTHEKGNKQTGDIETGINVGGYAKDAGCIIMFKCRVTGSEKCVVGKNTLRLWGQIDDGTVSLQDSADTRLIITSD